MEIGDMIRQARTGSKLTQEQAAEALGVSRQTISNWENGRSYPDIISVIRMSDLYSVSLDRLLKEETSLKQTYREYLEESTDTVKSRTRQSKLILILTVLGIWALSVIAFWLVERGVDTYGYSFTVMWVILPVVFFAASFIIAYCGWFGRAKWLAALGSSLMYTLTGYATVTAVDGMVYKPIVWPDFAKLPIGLAISLVGLGLGLLLRRRKTKQSETSEA